MARNLVVFCDGTWNTTDQRENGVPCPTNVVKLHNLCLKDEQQLCYYHPGVGTEGGIGHRILGGGLGRGLSQNIMSAYNWLCRNYQAGDQIFLFGFSRGAYTVRSLGGFVARCGLLDVSELAEKAAWNAVEQIYQQCYRGNGSMSRLRRKYRFLAPGTDEGGVQIHMIGVWDTVGALGVPDDMVLLDQVFDDPDNYRFHNTSLSDSVCHARHAVAMDERRASFAPTLWDPRPAATGHSLEQIWFPGVHSDVGGGYPECGLSDVALMWMASEAKSLGLRIEEKLFEDITPNARGVLHDSVSGIWEHMRTLPRAAPPVTEESVTNKSIDGSVLLRHQLPPLTQAPYWPTCRMAEGEQTTLPIFSRQHWNRTGIYLEAGKNYAFSATGEWLDASIACGPSGAADGKFHVGEIAYIVGDLFGEAEELYKRITRKENSDWRVTRRFEDGHWFALIGMVANQPNADGGGTPSPGETFVIGKRKVFGPKRSGYLYCYANDAWSFYGNNRGQVSLTVQCR